MYIFVLFQIVAISFNSVITQPTLDENHYTEEKWQLSELRNTMEELKKELITLKGQNSNTCSCHQTSRQPFDCDDIRTLGHTVSGEYVVYMRDEKLMGCCGLVEKKVYCEMDSTGTWTRILHRQDGEYDFPGKTWVQYEAGFGDVMGSHWMGLVQMHQLTERRQYKLRVVLTDWDGETRHAEYSSVYIGPWHNKYQLSIGFYNGTAGDSFSYHNNMYFTTIDRDNDKSLGNCASGSEARTGGWWHNNCFNARLTGHYVFGGSAADWYGLIWNSWRGKAYSYKVATMMIQQL